LKLLRLLAVVSLLAATEAVAQTPRMPAPMPLFRAPVVASAETPAETGAAPADRLVETIPIGPDTAATAAIATVTADPQPVTLSALATDGGATLGEGVSWRVFSTRPDAAGQLELAAESDNAVARVDLAPGNYVVHVAYGGAQASDTITVAEGENSKNIVLEVGGLRLNAAVSGDVPIPINLLRFDVFSTGTSDANRAIVAQGIGANDILTVSAGTYHIVSYFGDVNAVVRADLRVEPGELTDATLYHQAAQVSFKLVSESGGEAIADVDWTVKTGDGANTIFSNTGAFPSTVLQAGSYLVFAKRGDAVFNREFEVQPGQPREIEVLTAVY
jgi:hypothetical protein